MLAQLILSTRLHRPGRGWADGVEEAWLPPGHLPPRCDQLSASSHSQALFISLSLAVSSRWEAGMVGSSQGLRWERDLASAPR